MKKSMAALAVFALLTGGAFAGSSSITITPPIITDWDLGAGNAFTTEKQDAIDDLNFAIAGAFGDLEDTLNQDFFSKLHDMTDLSAGFANSNAAAWDNASLLGFQTYDLFAITLGTNFGLSLPSTDPSLIGSAFNSVLDKGDVYLGLATGGFGAQAGVNLGFLVKNLYVSGKFGFFPETVYNTSSDNGDGTVTFKQGMFGLGANYTILPQVDLLFGFIKWRGLSFGSGFTLNANSTSVVMALKDQTSDPQSVDIDDTMAAAAGVADPLLVSAKLTNIKTKLTVESTSFVIPLEVMTSLQALWFLNVGLGVGVDLNFASSRIALGGGSNFELLGIDNTTITPGKATVTATDTQGGGDFFVPRIAASLGMNLAVVKLDIPFSYYPTTKAFAFGVTAGIVW